MPKKRELHTAAKPSYEYRELSWVQTMAKWLKVQAASLHLYAQPSLNSREKKHLLE